MLSKCQRIVAFYILYELYHHENVKTTPFVPIVLRSLQECEMQPEMMKVEMKLLTDFLISVPKVFKQIKVRLLKRQ
jgi:hypothetical protein